MIIADNFMCVVLDIYIYYTYVVATNGYNVTMVTSNG